MIFLLIIILLQNFKIIYIKKRLPCGLQVNVEQLFQNNGCIIIILKIIKIKHLKILFKNIIYQYPMNGKMKVKCLYLTKLILE